MPGVVLVSPEGQREYVFDDELDAKTAAGYTPVGDGRQATVQNASGSTATISADDYVANRSPGQSAAGGVQQAADYREVRNEANYGGVGGGLAALGLGAARGATFGLSDLLVNEDAARGFAAENPGLDLLGNIGGGLATSVVTGLGSGAMAAGRALAPGSKAAAAMIGGGIEGAAFGVGQANSALILKNEPLTAEAVFTEYGTDIFLGAGFGAVGGLAGHGLETVGGKLMGRAARKLDDTDPEKILAANAAEPSAIPMDSERGKILTEDFVGGIEQSVKVADELAEEVARRPVLGAEPPLATKAGAPEAPAAPKTFADLPDDAFLKNYTARNLIQQMDQSALDASELATLSLQSSPKRFGHLKADVDAVKAADDQLKKLINVDLEPGATGPNTQDFGTGATKGRSRLYGPKSTLDADIPAVKTAMQAYHDAVEKLHGKLGLEMPPVELGDDFAKAAVKGGKKGKKGLARLEESVPFPENAAPEPVLGAIAPEVKQLATEYTAAKQTLLDGLFVRDGKIAKARTVKVMAELPFEELTTVANAYSTFIKNGKALGDALGPDFAAKSAQLAQQLERSMASLSNLTGSKGSSAAAGALPDTKQMLVALGVYETLDLVPDFEGPADDIVKLWIAARMLKGKGPSVPKAAAGQGSKNFAHRWLANTAGRVGYRAGAQGGGVVAGGVKGAAVSTAARWGVDQILGSTAALASSTGRTVAHAEAVVGQMLKGAGKATRRAAPFAPQALLKAMKFADMDHEDGTSVFEQRSREVRQNVANTMGMQTTVLRNLGELAMHHPGVADKVVAQAKRTMDFLAAKLPRDPGTVMRLGRSGWKPSEQDQAKWARFARAAADPDGELMRFAEGDMSVEGAETLRTLYPAKFAKFQEYIAANLTTLADKLAYPEQVQMSILFDVPVTSLMRPEVIKQIQANFAADASSDPISAPPPGSSGPSPLSPAQQLLTR